MPPTADVSSLPKPWILGLSIATFKSPSLNDIVQWTYAHQSQCKKALKGAIAFTINCIFPSVPILANAIGPSVFLIPVSTIFLLPIGSLGQEIESVLYGVLGVLCGMIYLLIMIPASIAANTLGQSSWEGGAAVRAIMLLIGFTAANYLKAKTTRASSGITLFQIAILFGATHDAQSLSFDPLTQVFFTTKPPLIGAVVCLLVNLVIFPETATKNLANAVRDSFRKLHFLFTISTELLISPPPCPDLPAQMHTQLADLRTLSVNLTPLLLLANYESLEASLASKQLKHLLARISSLTRDVSTLVRLAEMRYHMQKVHGERLAAEAEEHKLLAQSLLRRRIHSVSLQSSPSTSRPASLHPPLPEDDALLYYADISLFNAAMAAIKTDLLPLHESISCCFQHLRMDRKQWLETRKDAEAGLTTPQDILKLESQRLKESVELCREQVKETLENLAQDLNIPRDEREEALYVVYLYLMVVYHIAESLQIALRILITIEIQMFQEKQGKIWWSIIGAFKTSVRWPIRYSRRFHQTHPENTGLWGEKTRESSWWDPSAAKARKKAAARQREKLACSYTGYQDMSRLAADESTLDEGILIKNLHQDDESWVDILRWNLADFFKRFKTYQALFGLKVGIVLTCIALPGLLPDSTGWYTDIRGQWVGLMVIATIQPTFGVSSLNTTYQIFAAVVGCLWAYLNWISLGQHNLAADVLIILVFTFLLGLMAFYKLKFMLISIISYSLVFFSAFLNRSAGIKSDTIWQLIWRRGLAVGVASIVVFLTSFLFWPYVARIELRFAAANTIEDINELYSLIASFQMREKVNDVADDCISHTPSNLIITVTEGVRLERNTTNATLTATANLEPPLAQQRGASHYGDVSASSSLHYNATEEKYLQAQTWRLQQRVQRDLARQRALIDAASTEPRLKGPFPAKLWQDLLAILQRNADRLGMLKMCAEDMTDEAKEVFIKPNNEPRRAMVYSMQIFLYIVANSLRTKAPLPFYIPKAGDMRRSLMQFQRAKDGYNPLKAEFVSYFAYTLVMLEFAQDFERLNHLLRALMGQMQVPSNLKFEGFRPTFSANRDERAFEFDFALENDATGRSVNRH